MFGNQNDWKLIVMKPSKPEKGCTQSEVDDEIEAVFKDVREAMECMAVEDIEVGGFGAVQDEGGWTLCRWKSLPFTVEEDTAMDGAANFAIGTMVVRCLYYYELKSAANWYEPEGNGMYDEGQPTLIPCSTVVDGSLEMGRNKDELNQRDQDIAERRGYVGVSDSGLAELEDNLERRERLADVRNGQLGAED